MTTVFARSAVLMAVVGVVAAGCGNRCATGDRCAQSEPKPAAVASSRQAVLNGVPGAQTVAEDSPLIFSALGGNALTVSDDNALITVQVTVTNGVFVPVATAGVTISGSGTTSVTLTGQHVLPDGGLTGTINAALDGARFLPALHYNGPATLRITTSDSDGNSISDDVAITVTPFNDAPVNGAPGAVQAATEDVPYTFALPVTDVDLGVAPIAVELTASNGTLITLPRLTGLSFTLGDGATDAAMAFSGSLADVNAALNGLTIAPPLNYIGNSTLTITSRDNGATGAGLPGEDTDVITFAWAPVNDAPVNTVPGAQTIAEEASLTFTGATALSVADVDATNGLVQVTLDATNGALTLGNASAVSFSVGDGAGDATMTFTGTLADLATALAGTVFTPNANFAGAATVTLRSNDLGNSGAGGAKQDVDAVAVTVTGVNDPPVHTVPAGVQATNEDVAKVFSTATGSVIAVTDVDATSLQVTLAATNGALTLGTRTGLSFQAGDGTSDATMTFTGTVAAVNAALNGLSFVPTANYFGAAQVTIDTTDLGSAGSGPVGTDSDTITLAVASVNDAPDAVNDTLTVAEDSVATALTVLANDGTAPDLGETLTITSVSTPARGTATIVGATVTYQPQANFFGTDSFTYTVSDGTTSDGTPRFDTATVTVTVTSVNDDPTATDDAVSVLENAGATTVSVLSNDSAAPDVGETLRVTAVSSATSGVAAVAAGGTGVTYSPNPSFTGTDSFTYTLSDGNGGTDTGTVNVTVVAVQTRPVNTLPVPQQTVEDAALVFSSVAGNPLTVTDPNSATLTVQVQVTNGTFSLGSTTDLTVTANGTASVTAQGTLAALNAGLNGARYQPAANYNGGATLTVTSTDSLGEQDVDALTLTVIAVNDAPANTVPAGTQAVTEDVPRSFTTILVGDVDVGGNPLEVSLVADNGTQLTLSRVTGLSFTVGDGTADGALTFRGTVTDINAALNGLTVTPPLNFIGTSTLVLTTGDLGSTGNGGPLQDVDTLTLSWGAVNDAPVNGVPGPQATGEEAPLTFAAANALTVSDTDASAAVLQVTLSAANGTLTLGSTAAITFSAGDGTADGSMTFSGTLTALNAALAGTVFTPAADFAGATTVTLTTNDLGNSGAGGAKQDVDVVAITVGGANDAPVLSVPGAQATNEDVTKIFSAATASLITVADVDAAALQLSLAVTNGVLTLGTRTGLSFQAGDGTADAAMTFTGTVAAVNAALNGLTFVPTANYNGPAALTLDVSDLGSAGSGGTRTDSETVALTITSVNDAPDAVNDTLTVEEDSAVTALSVLANDGIAPDVGETLTLSSVSTAANGTTAIVGSTVTYRPSANFFGTDSFTYVVADGNGGTDTATVTVTVTSLNDNPTATADNLTVLQNAPATTVSVLSNDSAAPDVGETLRVTAVSAPANGTALVVSGGLAVTYQPAGGYAGADAFTYTLSDGNGGTATGTVTVTVVAVQTQPVNTLPVPQQTVEDSALVFSSVAGNAITVADANSATLTVQVQVTNGTFTLGATTGLTVTANGTASVTAQGTLAALNAGLNNGRYQPAANYNGGATLTVTSTDSLGEQDVDALTLTVIAVNDAPANTVPAGVQAVTEDVPKSFTTVLVGDVDVGGNPLEVSLVADNGTQLTLAQVTGLSFTVGDGTADGALTMRGSVTDLNAALNGLTVTPPLNFIGTSTVVLTTGDLGNTGTGGPLQDVDTLTLSWGAVNDAPVNGVPGPQAITEEATLAFSAANANALTVSDTDASAAVLQVTLSAASGTLSLGGTAGLTFSVGDGTGDGTMTFSGTLAALNTALDGTVFAPAANFAGATTVTLTTNDLGNSGTGGAKQDVDVVAVTVNGANDAPVLSVPGAQSTNEDVTKLFSAATASLITVADVDAAALQVTLSASSGTLTLGSRTGLSFQAGDGTDDASVTFTGTVAAVNAALNGLAFVPTANFFGPVTLSVLVSDLGSAGAGGALMDTETIALTVTSVNDAPNAVNDTLAVDEDAAVTALAVLGNDDIAPDVGETLAISAVSTAANGTTAIVGATVTYRPNANFFGTDSFTYTVADGNGGVDTATVTVTVNSVNDNPTAVADSLTVLQNASPTTVNVLSNDSAAPDVGEALVVTAVSAPAHGTALIVSGGLAVTYQPAGGYAGADTFTYTLSDGNGGTATATVSVTVTAVNTQPVNTLPVPQQTVEDTQLTFSSVVGNAITVTDANSATLTVQLQVTNGTFSLGSVVGLTVTGNGTASVTAQGTLAALNAGLNNARYQPALNYNGPATLTVTSTDSIGERDTDVLTLTVIAVNDAPLNTVPAGAQAVTEDVPKSFTTVLVGDVDVGGNPLEVTLVADNGTLLSLAQVTGLSFTVGDGTNDATLTVRGSVTDLNAALNGLTVTPPLNFIGTSTVVLTTGDLGNTGTGGPLQDVDTITLSWGSVNDAPVNTVPAAQTTVEETPLAFSAATANLLSVSDSDASSAVLQVTLSATNGTLSLGGTAAITFTAGDGAADATMTFSGTLVALNAALAGTVFTPAADFAGAATVTLTTNDLGNSGAGGARQDSDTVAITVTGVNDAPVHTVPAAQTTNEDVARVFSAANANAITVADVDASALQVTLGVSSGALTLGSRTGLTFQAGDGTADGSMTFTGPVAAVNTALSGLTFFPGVNYFGPVALSLVTSDLGSSGTGGALLDSDTVTITVVSVNDAPDALNDTLSVPEDAAATDVLVLGNDSIAPDVGETLTITTVSTPTRGTATTTGARVTYQPQANFYGTDSFTYTVSDGNGGADTATVTVTVTSVNDDPTAVADSVTVLQNSGPTTVGVLSNDSSDPDPGEALTVAVVSDPPHGTAAIATGGGAVTYMPDTGYTGADAFTYTLSDGNGGTATATVSVTVTAVNVNPVNTLPVPQQVIEDTQLTFSATNGNALAVADANSATLTVRVQVTGGVFTLGSTTNLAVTGNSTTTVTAQGTIAALNAGLTNARYVPTANGNGPATLTLETSDSDGNSDLDVLTMNVVAVNDAPVNTAPTGVQAVTEDVPRTFTNLLVADVDVGASSLEVTLTANNGTVLTLAQTAGLSFVTGDGAADAVLRFTGTVTSINSALNGLTVTPPANFIGVSTLVFTTNDQGNTGTGGAAQDSDTITLNWAADNDPPVNAVPGAQTVAEEGTFTFASAQGRGLSVSDVDVTSATMQVTLSATNGRLSVGTPSAVTFTAGDGTDDATMTFRGTVTAINTALDNTTFVPTLDFTGTAVVTLLSSDLGASGGGGTKTDTDTISVTVTPVNDAPVNGLPGPQSIAEDGSLLFNTANGNLLTVADVDATSLQVSLSALNGTVSLTTRTGLVFQVGDGSAASTMTFTGTKASINAGLNGLRFTPPANFEGLSGVTLLTRDLGATGTGGALFDEDTVGVTVVGVNDPPTATADSFTVDEDTTQDLQVLANDSFAPDTNEVLTLTAVSTPGQGTATLNGTAITYRPNANFFGTDTFTYTMSDGSGSTATATVTVTVSPVNDPPDARDDSLNIGEGAAAMTVNVLANDTIAPDTQETLTIVAVGTAGNGTVAITSNGTRVTYQPTAGYIGPDSFTYTISDGRGGSDTATVTVNVTNVDFQPVAVADTLTVAEDASATATVLANDTGLGDGPVVVTISSQATKGTATVQGDNSVVYVPAADATGADTFRYTVTDQDGDTAVGTVTVTITPVSDVPVAVDDSATTEEDTAVKVAVQGNDTGLVDLPVGVTVGTAPTHGTATVEADGTITYLPEANYAGNDTFTYVLTDGDGETATATVRVTVTAVNDAPVAVGDAAGARVGGTVEIDVLANDTDVDGDTLTIASVTTPAHGTATIVAGKVQYVGAAGYRGSDQFDYVVSDGTLTATGTVVVGVGVDTDGDGLQDVEEPDYGTDPLVADTDGDLIPDGLEVTVTKTAPLDDDSDDDGLLDGREDTNRNGMLDDGETDPTKADTDGDGLLDGTEKGLTVPEGEDTATTVFVADLDPGSKTDPRKADSDGAGLTDGAEDANHNGRVDPGETNPLNSADDQPEAPDGDQDGVPDATDNCPSVANSAQSDTDKDGVGDLCEAEEPTGCGCSAGSAGGAPVAVLLWGLWAARRRRAVRG